MPFIELTLQGFRLNSSGATGDRQRQFVRRQLTIERAAYVATGARVVQLAAHPLAQRATSSSVSSLCVLAYWPFVLRRRFHEAYLG